MPVQKTLHRAKLPGALLVVLILLGISVFINYIDRGNLAIAAPLLKDELHVRPEQLGLLLSAFFWTYATLQPVYGWLVDRLNVYWVLGTGFLFWSLATAATGLVHTFTALFMLRLTVGIGEAVCYPSYSKIIALNYSEEHRGLANSVISAGLSLGPGVGMLLGGTMVGYFGWRPFFIALGLGSLLWFPAWVRWMPRNHVVPPSGSSGAPNLIEFLHLRSAWGTCLGLWCGNYTNYFLLTWLPYYLVRGQHFSITDMAKVGAAGYFSSACSAIFCGWLSDRWIRAGGSPTRVRKMFTGGGMLVYGAVFSVLPFTGPRSCIALLIVAMAFFGASASNLYAITQRLAGPHAAGRWTGFQNGFGNLAGVVVPVVTGYALSRTGNFTLAFAILAIVALLGGACWFFVVGRVEQVTWGKRAGPRLAIPVTTVMESADSTGA
jgi:MFS family permease